MNIDRIFKLDILWHELYILSDRKSTYLFVRIFHLNSLHQACGGHKCLAHVRHLNTESLSRWSDYLKLISNHNRDFLYRDAVCIHFSLKANGTHIYSVNATRGVQKIMAPIDNG